MLRPTKMSLLAFLVLIAAGVTLAAQPDVKGKWTWTQTRPDGSKVKIILTLNSDGQKLSGTYQGEGPDSEIFDGSLKGNVVTFSTKREVEKHNVTLTYTGKLDGNTIAGKMNAHFGFKHREENWTATRVEE